MLSSYKRSANQATDNLEGSDLGVKALASIGVGQAAQAIVQLSPTACNRIRAVNRLALERARVGYLPNGWILQSAEKSGNSTILAECLLTKATALACSGHPKQARSVLTRVQALLADGTILDSFWSWRLHNSAGIVADDFAELRDTWTHHQESLRIALAAEEVVLVATSRLNLGYLAIRIGMYGEALVQLMEIVAVDGLRKELFVGTHLMVSRLFHEQGDAELAWHHRQLAEERGGRAAGFEHTRLLLDMTALTTDLYDERWLIAHVRRVRAFGATTGSELTRLEASLYEAKIHHGAGEVARAVDEVRAVVDRCPDGLAIQPVATLTLAGFLVDSGQYAEAASLLEGAVLSPAPAMLSYRAAELRSIAFQKLGRWREAASCLDELDELSNARTQDVLTIVEFQKASHNSDQVAQQNDLLRTKNLELEALNQDKEAIMNMVANDFQSPLTALQLALQLLGADLSSSNVDRHIDTALRTISRVEVSAEQLSLAGEMEYGSLSYDIELFDLYPFLMRLQDSVSHTGLGCSGDADLREALDVVVASDEERVRQILESLCTGAAALTGAGSPLLMDASVEGSRVLLRIEAPELMLSEDVVNRIRRTARVSSHAPNVSDSSPDLSLYVADRLSQVIGCPISIQPRKPCGTEFSLALPLAVAKSAEEQMADRS